MTKKKLRTASYRFKIYILLATLSIFGTTLLPVMLISEFGFREYVSTYILYFPHMTFYPLLIFWAAPVCLYFIFRFMPLNKGRIRLLLKCAIPAAVLSAAVTYGEQSGDKMMLFEFSQDVQNRYCMKKIVKGVDRGRIDFKTSDCLGFQRFLKGIDLKAGGLETSGETISLTYEAARKSFVFDELFRYHRWNYEDYSYSRFGYIISFFSMIFFVLLTYTLAIFLQGPVKRALKEKEHDTPRKRFFYFYFRTLFSGIVISVLTFFIWILTRVYYNGHVKEMLFEEEKPIIENIYFGAPEVIIMLVSLAFLVTIFTEIFGPNNSLIGFLLAVLPPFVAIFYFVASNPSSVPILFGLNPVNPVVIVMWPCFLALVVWYFLIRMTRVR